MRGEPFKGRTVRMKAVGRYGRWWRRKRGQKSVISIEPPRESVSVVIKIGVLRS